MAGNLAILRLPAQIEPNKIRQTDSPGRIEVRALGTALQTGPLVKMERRVHMTLVHRHSGNRDHRHTRCPREMRVPRIMWTESSLNLFRQKAGELLLNHLQVEVSQVCSTAILDPQVHSSWKTHRMKHMLWRDRIRLNRKTNELHLLTRWIVVDRASSRLLRVPSVICLTPPRRRHLKNEAERVAKNHTIEPYWV